MCINLRLYVNSVTYKDIHLILLINKNCKKNVRIQIIIKKFRYKQKTG